MSSLGYGFRRRSDFPRALKAHPPTQHPPAILLLQGTRDLRLACDAWSLRGAVFPWLLPPGAAALKTHALGTGPIVLWLFVFSGGSGLARSCFSPLGDYESTKEMARVKFAPA
ncbi:hypothetical protein XAC3261 [Xanthomonas citri pv. citri str. 306]|uniref:Uncharacterized protein n=1 Tax=Xanthomonas axonopodis pv. citri (strain 306) TaxID=190486 RepID=A0AAI7ZHG1_XANAC|nr:hypothetical protein XAC3261 [Xanthomonas citri pv. citri str. 306]